MTDARLYSRIEPRNGGAALDVPRKGEAAEPGLRRINLATPMWNLTPQQWRVFLLVGKALSNKAIAHELKVAESTVKAHVSAIFKMAGCRNRTEAALLSQRVRYGISEVDEGLPTPFAMPAAAAGTNPSRVLK